MPSTPQPQPDDTPRLAAALKAIDEILSVDSIFCSRFQELGKIDLKELDREYRLYVAQVVNMMASLFSDYTGDRCAVCIKMFNLTEDVVDPQTVYLLPREVEPPFVRTFWRDSRSFQERHVIIDQDPKLKMYRIRHNTGLTQARKHGYWHCNDLTLLGKDYHRSNKIWPRFYNATAIVNLAYRSEGHSINPIGFLCVDNMKGGFDAEGCRHIMEILANLVHFSMRMTFSAFVREMKHEQAVKAAQ